MEILAYQIVPLNTIVKYVLPATSDYNSCCQIVTIDLLLSDGKPLPHFVAFTDSKHTELKFFTSLAADVGTYQLTLTLFDGIDTSSFTLNVEIVFAAVILQAIIDSLTKPPPPFFAFPITNYTLNPY